ncbi:hypothetical protein [Saccharicrinis aurantiacus]|uniref:hypothetical protein n=1 Tax=Saccharicrinis aurantiacus TaxID=1849719 RepID=UPI002490B997|nr:hypothetical protein [Saccharicrinis aurantiacus]
MRVIVFFCLLVVCGIDSYSQLENKQEILDPKKTNEIQEVYAIGYRSVKVDTSELKISCVLEMQLLDSVLNRKTECGLNDFIVLYRNQSGVYFSMGCAWTCDKVYWTVKSDTLQFYSWKEIERELEKRQLTTRKEISDYISRYGKRISIGSNKYGFYNLVSASNECYNAFDADNRLKNYIFIREEEISDCHKPYYEHIIKK